MNDAISSVFLKPYDPIQEGAVTLFSDSDCRGRSAVFFGPKDLLDRQGYVLSDFNNRDFGNDSASSLMIPYGYKALLYSDGGFVS